MAGARAKSRLRLVPVVFLVAAVALLILQNASFRGFEARCARPIVGLVTGAGSSSAVRDVVFFSLGTNHAVGLRITTGCTTVVLLVPYLLIMAAIVAKSTVPVTRILAATAIGAAMLVTVNVLRLTVIAWATSVWGLKRGFEISHFLVGSILALAGFAAAMVVSVRLLTLGGGARHRPRAQLDS